VCLGLVLPTVDKGGYGGNYSEYREQSRRNRLAKAKATWNGTVCP